jgi:hypothetical protein
MGLGAAGLEVRAQRRREAKMIEERGPQMLDQAPFDAHCLVEDLPKLGESRLIRRLALA